MPKDKGCHTRGRQMEDPAEEPWEFSATSAFASEFGLHRDEVLLAFVPKYLWDSFLLSFFLLIHMRMSEEAKTDALIEKKINMWKIHPAP